ncbi:intracellular adhesion protein IcaD [Phocicoccus pinnipedialis]|uniref:intracellular adhesion protein IcaD n=1 Tax=Phocicoccus pinnipedialis TaxID=110845 RepID=UPI001640EA61
MVKSRQRKYPTVKSSLNFVTEALLVILSTVLWMYCLLSVFIVLSLFSLQDFEVSQFFRIIFNLERTDLQSTLMIIGILVVTITVYLLCSYSFRTWRKKHEKVD